MALVNLSSRAGISRNIPVRRIFILNDIYYIGRNRIIDCVRWSVSKNLDHLNLVLQLVLVPLGPINLSFFFAMPVSRCLPGFDTHFGIVF